ncbi:site-2 protease family protein [Candidatus Gottesmanbacteria bacterium]|nr:site-2 protease family protein [Candidatus Gottesmanbacteria bacterium]
MLAELFNNPFSFLIWTVALLVAITIHEFSHAFMADRLGDPTARLMGRLTLNPLAHLDPLGTLFLLIARFGWGKPVPFDPFNLRNPRRDSALISLAGPGSNLILATILSLILRAIPYFPLPEIVFLLVQAFFIPIIILNVGLAIFNLLPVHPLDGFKIVTGFLPKKLAYQWQELEGYGLFFLLLLLLPLSGGPLLLNILGPIVSIILTILLPGLGTII